MRFLGRFGLRIARRSRWLARRLWLVAASERREAAELLEKVNYAELGGNVAATLVPFRPVRSFVEFVLGRPAKARRRAAAAES